MLDFNKSQKQMLAKEAEYMEKLQEMPDVNAAVLAAMSTLYRSGWRDCWVEQARAELAKTVEVITKWE
jgi:hypothetical protein